MKNLLLVLFIFQMGFNLQAQQKGKYWISFTDKEEMLPLLERPSLFLSQKAIERRQLQGIAIDKSDLPVSKAYIAKLKALEIDIIFASRWMNMVSAELNAEQIKVVNELTFVSRIDLQTGFYKDGQNKEANITNDIVSTSELATYYGLAENQIEMLKGIELHDLDYKGQEMTIAVLDAGFRDADSLPIFQEAWINNRIEIGPDFVRGNDTLVDFSHSTHGTNVLGFMAGNIPETYVGTAPLANYILIRTENAPSEDIVEEHYWLQGAEYADSLGADLINSSLGYTTFDDSLQSHNYYDLDGNTTLITNAADMAASKGILVVSSAGNSGSQEWHFISAPADADSVLTIGSVNGLGVSSPFSSHGPTADGRIKPNIVAQGQFIFTANIDSSFYPSSGTSFSAPVLTGMAACLWQYKREVESSSVTNMEIISLLETSSSLFPFSNADMGYGIPNFELAMFPLTLSEEFMDQVSIYPNPFDNVLHIEIGELIISDYQLIDIFGRIIFHGTNNEMNTSLEIQWPSELVKGTYFLKLTTNGGELLKKLIK